MIDRFLWAGAADLLLLNKCDLASENEKRDLHDWFHDLAPDLPVVIGERIFSLTVAGPLYRVAEMAETHATAIHDAIATEFGRDHSTATLTGLEPI